MRAHRGTHLEGEFHLVKRALQIRGLNRANDSATFIARDLRLVTTELGEQAAATARCSEISMWKDWAGFRFLFVAVHDSRISRRRGSRCPALLTASDA